MKTNKTKALREGAMMVALTVVLILITVYVPFLSGLCTVACGIPLGALAARNGLKGLVPAFISVMFVAFLVVGNLISTVSLLLMSVLPGMVAGFVLGKKKNFFSALFATCIAVCVGWMFELFVLSTFAGQGIDSIFEQSMNMTAEVMKPLKDVMTQSGITFGNMSAEEFLDFFVESIGKLMRLYFPTIIIISSMVEGYIILRVCAFAIKRTRIAEIDVVPFSEMKAPRSMCFVGVLCYFAGMFTSVDSAFGALLANAVFILYTMIGLCGLSFVDYKIKASIKPAMARFCIYGMIFFFAGFLMSFIATALIIVGILDSTRDFRKLGAAEE